MIVPLARVHGVSPVAQALGLNYTALKGRVVGGRAAPASGGQSAGGFVEVPVAPWPAGSQYILELEDRLGLKLTLRLAQGEHTEALALAQGLWRHRS
jgi:hypothetical protein